MRSTFLVVLISLSFSPSIYALNDTEQKTNGACSPAIHNTTGNIELNCNGLSKIDEQRLIRIFNDALKGFDSLQTIGLLTTLLNESRSQSINHQIKILELEKKLNIQIKRIKNILDDGAITEQVKSLIKVGKLNEAEQLVDKNSKQLDDQDEKQAAKHYEAGRIKELRINYVQAEQHFSKAAALQPYNSTYLDAYGSILDVQGEYNKAIKYYELALQLDLNTYGLGHPEVATSRNNVGAAYMRLGQYDKAIEYLKLALQPELQGHPEFVTAHNNLALAYSSLRQYKEAIKHLKQAIHSDLKTYKDLATSSNTLAGIYFELGQYEKSIESYEHALQASLKAYGQDHPNVAITYTNLGAVYSSLGRYDKAIKYLKLALQANQETVGQDHPSLAYIYSNLGTVNYSLGKYNESIKLYNFALRSNLNTYGKDHPDVATSHSNLGMVINH